ncbi:DNA repair protein RecO [Pasteurellaceae bacterium LFhippo2]|nr:DNA repair protein RecO [Pasteurellaceae bacterium LFhippo2]
MEKRGFILHRREYSETSLIVDLFTEHHGRVSLLAKGARRPRSKLKGILQPFTLVDVEWIGKGDLKTLTSAEGTLTIPLENFALYSGFYVNEILTRVLEPHTAYPEIFYSYYECIKGLALNSANLEPSLRTFEFKLLQALGYGVNFTNCAATGLPIDEKMTYQFQENEGFVASLLQNNNTYLGKDLLAFEALDFSEKSTQQAAKRFTRMALKPYLGNAPLKSRELFQSILPNRLKA